MVNHSLRILAVSPAPPVILRVVPYILRLMDAR
jgi:hypothetical protein